MKKSVAITFSILWGFYLLLAIFVWTNLRHVFFSYNPVVETLANLFQDIIWLPLAIWLPASMIFLSVKAARYPWLKFAVALFFSALTLIIFINLPHIFPYLFYLIIPFISLIIYHIFYFHRLRLHLIFYSLAVLLLIFNYQGQLLPGFSLHRKAQALKLMSYNIQVNLPSGERRQILEIISAEKADIVFIQEINTYDRKLFSDYFRQEYPFQLYADRYENYNGGIILSRLPFREQKNIDIRTEHMRGHTNLNYAIIRFQNRDIHLFNIHLYPSGHEMIEWLLQKRGMSSYLDLAKKAYLRRVSEAHEVINTLKGIDEPVIIAGDFNDTPNSQVYNLFNSDFTNAFAQAGWGLGTTFGAKHLLNSVDDLLKRFVFDILRIDHIFISHHFQIKDAAVLDNLVSDHKPQTAVVKLK